MNYPIQPEPVAIWEKAMQFLDESKLKVAFKVMDDIERVTWDAEFLMTDHHRRGSSTFTHWTVTNNEFQLHGVELDNDTMSEELSTSTFYISFTDLFRNWDA